VIFFPETFPDQPLGDRDRELSYLPAKFLFGPAHILFNLGPATFHDARGLLPRGL
jgi:hypothetical protein